MMTSKDKSERIHLSPANLATWSEAAFWRKKCPDLSISDTPDTKEKNNHEHDNSQEASPSPSSSPSSSCSEYRRQLAQDGYALVDNNDDDDNNDPLQQRLKLIIDKLHQGVQQLEESFDLRACFILLFDEAWELARYSRTILSQSTHPNNQFNFDILTWYIRKEGFSPHRDRQPEHVADSFHPQTDDPKFVTHWIALSEATPHNSCLYVIPKSNDPGYMTGDDDDDDERHVDESPLSRALHTKEAYQHIHAIPRSPGTSLLFTHRIIHWGSARYPHSDLPPRVAISFVCSDPDFEKPYVDVQKFFPQDKLPPFSIRLLLVCAQLLIYYQRFHLTKDTIKACYEYCKANEQFLEESYKSKVFFEFVKAMKEANEEEQPTGLKQGNTTTYNNNSTTNNNNKSADEEENEDDEEAMLEEMLNAENRGYGEFDDDFDNIDSDAAVGCNDDDDDDNDEEDEEFAGLTPFGQQEQPKAKRLKTDR